jgi:hypothetical protein
MRKTILAFLIALALAAPLAAQTPVAAVASADDTDIAFLVRYVGAENSATVAVAVAGQLTFQVGGAAYTGFECPVAGALGGIIDTTNAACNTIQEVVDTINGNCTGCASDFRAVTVDALGTDSSDNTLLTIGATQVTRSDGLPIYYESAQVDFATRALTNCRTIDCFGVSPRGSINENPFGGTQTFLQWINGSLTFDGGGVSTFTVYSVKSSNKTAGKETVTTLWSGAGAATTVLKEISAFQNVPLIGRPHEKIIVRMTGSGVTSTMRMLAYGRIDSVH